MIWIGLGLVLLVVFLILSGKSSDRRHIEFYRTYFTYDELVKLADTGSAAAKKALGRND